MTTETLYLLTPEILVIAAAVAIYLGGAFFTAQRLWSWIGGGAVALAGLALLGQRGLLASDGVLSHGDLFHGVLFHDGLASLGRWLALFFVMILLAMSSRSASPDSATHHEGEKNEPERVGSLLLAGAGLMLVVQASDLVLLFLGLELISIPTYILLYLGRHDSQGQEATVKYFYLSVLASCILLYGFSFLYGVAGSTQLPAIRGAMLDLQNKEASFVPFAQLAMVLICAGLCFKITAVPFHFYAPDVYQGTTHANAALLSVIPKAAGLAVMVRVLVHAMPGMSPHAWQMVAALAAVTMTLGNVVALWQDNLRRLFAYSAIAHAGYMLIALAVRLATPEGTAGLANAGDWDGIAALWFYLITYAVATLGAFAAFESLGRADRRIDSVEELAGLGQTQPTTAALIAVFMFSLAGIPLLAGFWGKFWVFGSALNVGDAGEGVGGPRLWFVALAVLGMLNAAVAAVYYLRIVAVMFFRPPLATLRPEGGRGPRWMAALCAVLVLAMGVYAGPWMRITKDAAVMQGSKQEPSAVQAVQGPMNHPPLHHPDLDRNG